MSLLLGVNHYYLGDKLFMKGTQRKDLLRLLQIAWLPLAVQVVRVTLRPPIKFVISNNLMDVC